MNEAKYLRLVPATAVPFCMQKCLPSILPSVDGGWGRPGGARRANNASRFSNEFPKGEMEPFCNEGECAMGIKARRERGTGCSIRE